MNMGSEKDCIRILHIITGLSTGGAERMLVRLLAQGSAGHVVVSLRGDGPQGVALRALGVPVYLLGLRPWRWWRLLRELRPQRVVGWMYHGNLVATLVGWLCRVPVVWNVRHSVADLRRERPALRWVIRAGAWLSASPRVIVYNSAVAAGQHEELGYDARRTLVLPNGVDTVVFAPSASARVALCDELGLPAQAFIVGHLARFHPMKDHVGFLQAAALLRASVPEAHFVMAGRGVDQESAALVAEIERLGLAGHVHLLGERGNVSALLAGLDLFVLSSAWGEGFPNVVVEAMACGVPVVTTDVGDAAAVVGETGRVVAPGEPQALAEAMVSLYELGEAERRALGEVARRRVVESFAIAAVAQRYQATWRVE